MPKTHQRTICFYTKQYLIVLRAIFNETGVFNSDRLTKFGYSLKTRCMHLQVPCIIQGFLLISMHKILHPIFVLKMKSINSFKSVKSESIKGWNLENAHLTFNVTGYFAEVSLNVWTVYAANWEALQIESHQKFHKREMMPNFQNKHPYLLGKQKKTANIWMILNKKFSRKSGSHNDTKYILDASVSRNKIVLLS